MNRIGSIVSIRFIDRFKVSNLVLPFIVLQGLYGSFLLHQSDSDIATTEPSKEAKVLMHSWKPQELDKSMISNTSGIDSLIAMSFPTTITTFESSSAHSRLLFSWQNKGWGMQSWGNMLASSQPRTISNAGCENTFWDPRWYRQPS